MRPKFHKQLSHLVGCGYALERVVRTHPSKQTQHDDDALLISVLTGFPDRVARRKNRNEVLLSTGVSAEIAGEPSVYEFMVAIDAEDRKDKPLPR